MGLETVELAIATEEAFDIEITDEEAERIITAGDLYDCVMGKLAVDAGRISKPDGYAVWMKLRGLIATQLGIETKRVLKSSKFIEDLKMD